MSTRPSGVAPLALKRSAMSNSSSGQTNQARVKRPQREQMELRSASLNQMIPPDHRVRAVWDYVAGLDLSPLYRNIRAVEGQPGRDAVDPRILMTLWMFATIEAIGIWPACAPGISSTSGSAAEWG